MSSTAPRGTDVKNKLPPNNTNNNNEIAAVPTGPTLPPSAVSNPGIIGTGPSFLPLSNPNGSDFFGGSGASSSFVPSSPSPVLAFVVVVVVTLKRFAFRKIIARLPLPRATTLIAPTPGALLMLPLLLVANMILMLFLLCVFSLSFSLFLSLFVLSLSLNKTHTLFVRGEKCRLTLWLFSFAFDSIDF